MNDFDSSQALTAKWGNAGHHEEHGRKQIWVPVLDLSPTRAVTLGKWLDFQSLNFLRVNMDAWDDLERPSSSRKLQF